MMRTIKLFGLATVIVAFSVSCLNAQGKPKITNKYSNTEIENLLNANKMTHSRNVIPTTQLTQRFVTDFPKTNDVEWELGADVYEVEFEVGFTDHKAYYDNQGNLLMYKYDIKSSELPTSINNIVTTKYPGYKFEDIEKIQRGTEILYKIEVEKGDYEVKLLLKSDGTIVNEYFD